MKEQNSHDRLKALYVQLEAVDLGLLLEAQNRSYQSFDHFINQREETLTDIEQACSQLGGCLSPQEKKTIQEMQERAMHRNHRIMAVVGALYNQSRAEYLRCKAGGTNPSPYMKEISPRRVKA